MDKFEKIESAGYVAHHADQEIRVGGDWIPENVLGLGDTEDEAKKNALINAGHNSINRDEITITPV